MSMTVRWKRAIIDTVRTVEDERVAVDSGGVIASSTAVDAVVGGRDAGQSKTTSLHLH